MKVTTLQERTGAGQELYRKAKLLIPGGTQLLSKRPEMLLPEQWPAYYSRAKGAEVWDLDGNRYLDFSYSGIGACPLGYSDPDVDDAVREAIGNGSMCTLNCAEEVELAELLLEIHPWAELVRYARTGGEAMALAVRIARSATRREKIAFCGYHGWHDWYLAANLGTEDRLDGHLLPGLQPQGVPRALQGTALAFNYNQLDELKRIAHTHGPDLAAVVMEPLRNQEPEDGFLEGVRSICGETGAALVFDEITSGWRLICGGAHLIYQVEPDMAVFAKGMSNGYPMAAIVGTGDIMRSAQNSFISSTYWTERIGPTAALATIRKYRQKEVAEYLIALGGEVRKVWLKAAESASLPITVNGILPLGHFTFVSDNHQAIRTLFTQMMLERGFLASNAFYAMYAHTAEQVQHYASGVSEVFHEISRLVSSHSVEKSLHGPVAHTGFRRLT
jgi:glutamate-1-semialdehyde 2,1-aminomutase